MKTIMEWTCDSGSRVEEPAVNTNLHYMYIRGLTSPPSSTSSFWSSYRSSKCFASLCINVLVWLPPIGIYHYSQCIHTWCHMVSIAYNQLTLWETEYWTHPKGQTNISKPKKRRVLQDRCSISNLGKTKYWTCPKGQTNFLFYLLLVHMRMQESCKIVAKFSISNLVTCENQVLDLSKRTDQFLVFIFSLTAFVRSCILCKIITSHLTGSCEDFFKFYNSSSDRYCEKTMNIL